MGDCLFAVIAPKGHLVRMQVITLGTTPAAFPGYSLRLRCAPGLPLLSAQVILLSASHMQRLVNDVRVLLPWWVHYVCAEFGALCQ